MKLQQVIDALQLTPVTDVEERDVEGVFISDMLSDVMSSAKANNLWITVQTHKNIVSAVNLIDIAAVVVTHGKAIPQDTIDLANRFHVVILVSPHSTYEVVKQLIGMEVPSL